MTDTRNERRNYEGLCVGGPLNGTSKVHDHPYLIVNYTSMPRLPHGYTHTGVAVQDAIVSYSSMGYRWLQVGNDPDVPGLWASDDIRSDDPATCLIQGYPRR